PRLVSPPRRALLRRLSDRLFDHGGVGGGNKIFFSSLFFFFGFFFFSHFAGFRGGPPGRGRGALHVECVVGGAGGGGGVRRPRCRGLRLGLTAVRRRGPPDPGAPGQLAGRSAGAPPAGVVTSPRGARGAIERDAPMAPGGAGGDRRPVAILAARRTGVVGGLRPSSEGAGPDRPAGRLRSVIDDGPSARLSAAGRGATRPGQGSRRGSSSSPRRISPRPGRTRSSALAGRMAVRAPA